MIVNIAAEYMGANKSGIARIMNYYNEFVFPLVEPSRKYRIQPNDDWCMAFCSVVAHKAGIKRFPWEVSTYYALQLLEARGDAFTRSHEAKRGDLVFFDWNGSGTPNHVGFVVNVGDDTVSTIEGNKGGTVGTRTISHTSGALLAFAGVGRGAGGDPVRTARVAHARVESLAYAVLRGEYGDGDARREALGDDYGAVQSVVNHLLKK